MSNVDELKEEIKHVDRLIKFHQEHRKELMLNLILSCKHTDATGKKTRDYDRWDYDVYCNDCDCNLFSGNSFQYTDWKKKYSGELTEVNT